MAWVYMAFHQAPPPPKRLAHPPKDLAHPPPSPLSIWHPPPSSRWISERLEEEGGLVLSLLPPRFHLLLTRKLNKMKSLLFHG
jgi:hypothetical protein